MNNQIKSILLCMFMLLLVFSNNGIAVSANTVNVANSNSVIEITPTEKIIADIRLNEPSSYRNLSQLTEQGLIYFFQNVQANNLYIDFQDNKNVTTNVVVAIMGFLLKNPSGISAISFYGIPLSSEQIAALFTIKENSELIIKDVTDIDFRNCSITTLPQDALKLIPNTMTIVLTDNQSSAGIIAATNDPQAPAEKPSESISNQIMTGLTNKVGGVQETVESKAAGVKDKAVDAVTQLKDKAAGLKDKGVGLFTNSGIGKKLGSFFG